MLMLSSYNSSIKGCWLLLDSSKTLLMWFTCCASTQLLVCLLMLPVKKCLQLLDNRWKNQCSYLLLLDSSILVEKICPSLLFITMEICRNSKTAISQSLPLYFKLKRWENYECLSTIVINFLSIICHLVFSIPQNFASPKICLAMIFCRLTLQLIYLSDTADLNLSWFVFHVA